MCGEAALRNMLNVLIGMVVAAIFSLGLAMVANGSFYGAIAAPVLLGIVGVGMGGAAGFAGNILIRLDNFVICRRARRGGSSTACQGPLNLAKVELAAIIAGLATASTSAFVIIVKAAVPAVAQPAMVVLFASLNATLMLLGAYWATFVVALIGCLSRPAMAVTPPGPSGPPSGPHTGDLTIDVFSCPVKEPRCPATAMSAVPPRTAAATTFAVSRKSIITVHPTANLGNIIGMAADVSDSSGTTIPLPANYMSPPGSAFFNGTDTNWLVEINALELDTAGHLKIAGLKDDWTVTLNADVQVQGGGTQVVSRTLTLVITTDS